MLRHADDFLGPLGAHLEGHTARSREKRRGSFEPGPRRRSQRTWSSVMVHASSAVPTLPLRPLAGDPIGLGIGCGHPVPRRPSWPRPAECTTMVRTLATTRPGKTVKVSISIDKADLAVLRRRARESYRGNLSAAFSEAARLIRQRAARTRLIDMLGGPTLTADAAKSIDAEQAEHPGESKKARRARAA
jgi:hypothetical protein